MPEKQEGATVSSWTTNPMPDAHETIDMDVHLSGDAHIFRLTANRDKEQYGCTSMEKDKALFMFLLCSEMGTDGSSFWKAYCRAE